MIPCNYLHLLDDNTLINIIAQLTNHPETDADDAELLRIASDIGAARFGADRLNEAVERIRLVRQPLHPFMGISVYEINYRVEVDPHPSWWPAGTWEHFRQELAGFADDVDTEVEPERFWLDTSDSEVDPIGRLNDVIQAWQVALARRNEPLEPGFGEEA